MPSSSASCCGASVVASTEAWKRLDAKFGMRRESATEMMEGVLAGKAIAEKDHAALLLFYGKLSGVYTIACDHGRAGEFETRAIVDAIIRRKLPHLATKWARECARTLRRTGIYATFSQFLEFVDDAHFVSEQTAMMLGAPAGSAQASSSKSVGAKSSYAKVAATDGQAIPRPSPSSPTSGSRRRVASSPASTPCVCCSGTHAIADCGNFRNLESGAKRTYVRNFGLCFRCLGGGHIASSCPASAKCDICQGGHLAVLHDLQPSRTSSSAPPSRRSPTPPVAAGVASTSVTSPTPLIPLGGVGGVSST